MLPSKHYWHLSPSTVSACLAKPHRLSLDYCHSLLAGLLASALSSSIFHLAASSPDIKSDLVTPLGEL